jgi:diguanylate cyclase (GGDEF)-like protein/PAS domain S-box-containing protein
MDLDKFLDELYEAAYMVDENRKILYWNKKAENISGYKKEEIIGKFCYDNILRHVSQDGKRICHDGCPLVDSLRMKKINETKVYLHHKLGYRVPVTVKTFPFLDPLDNKHKVIELFTDYKEESSLYEENKNLQRQVITDNLTGCFNRAFIDYQIDTCINEYNVFNTDFGLLFMDIDNFKKVNDNYGHEVGDLVLKAVSNTVRKNIRAEDYVGRYGGEEFVVLFRGINKENLFNSAEKLRMLIEGIEVETSKGKLAVTVSIGCKIYEKHLSKDELVKGADKLMYQAKETGKNRVLI